MSDFLEITNLLARKKGRAVLVTLVDVEGSSYRKPGARMVVSDDGEAAGAISGGCLETALRQHAIESMEAAPHTFVIDTTTDSDLIFGHGLGCPGKLTFLIEPFHAGSEPAALTAWRSTVQDRERRVVLTLFDSKGSPVRSSVIRSSSLSDGESRPQYRRAWESRRSHFTREDEKELFIDVIEAPVRILLIGSGLDVPPFAKLAGSAGLEVLQIANTERSGVSCHVAAPEDVPSLAIDSRTAVVVMTHNYLLDLEYLRALEATTPMYLGVIGSKGRFERLMKDLKSAGVSAEWIMKVAGPAGLDLGAETPAQIALSVLAEIQGVAGGKPRARQTERGTSRAAAE